MNPAFVTSSVYCPGCSRVRRNAPSPLVRALRVSPVAMSVILITAPPTAAAEGSVIVPPMAPVPPVCADSSPQGVSSTHRDEGYECVIGRNNLFASGSHLFGMKHLFFLFEAGELSENRCEIVGRNMQDAIGSEQTFSCHLLTPEDRESRGQVLDAREMPARSLAWDSLLRRACREASHTRGCSPQQRRHGLHCGCGGGFLGDHKPTSQFQAISPCARRRQTTSSLNSYMPGSR